MCFHRRAAAPTGHDEIDAPPERDVVIMIVRQVIEQSHPKSGQRLVINIDMMMRGEAQEHFAHAFSRLLERMFRQIA